MGRTMIASAARCFALALLVAGGAGVARAEDPEQMEARVGLDGKGRAGCIVPVRVVVSRAEAEKLPSSERTGPKEITVTVEDRVLVQRSEAVGTRLVLPKLTLQPSDRKAVEGLGSCEAGAWVYATGGVKGVRPPYQSLAPDTVFLIASLGGAPGWSQFLHGRVIFAGSPDAPASTQEEEGMRFLRMPNGSFGTMLTFDIEVAAPAIADLPGSYLGYHSANLVVVSDLTQTPLTTPQADALRRHVMGGGAMLVLGGPGAAATFAGPLGELLPGRPLALADRASVAPYVQALGLAAKAPAGAFTLLPIEPTTGEVLARTAGGEAFLWRRRYGLGYVLYTSLDLTGPPVRGWEREWEVWVRLLAGYLPAVAPLRLCPGASFPSDTSPPDLHPPGRGFVVWFLVAYVVIVGPVNFGLLRLFDRSEWLWYTTPGLVLSFFGATFVIAFATGGATVVRQLTVIRAEAGSPDAVFTTFVRVFTPQGQSVRLTVGDPEGVIRPFVVRGSEDAAVLEVTKSATGLESGRIRLTRWAERDYYVDGATAAPRVEFVRAASGVLSVPAAAGYRAQRVVQPLTRPDVRLHGQMVPRLEIVPRAAMWAPGLARESLGEWADGLRPILGFADPALAAYLPVGPLDGDFWLACSDGDPEGYPGLTVDCRGARVTHKVLWIVHVPPGPRAK